MGPIKTFGSLRSTPRIALGAQTCGVIEHKAQNRARCDTPGQEHSTNVINNKPDFIGEVEAWLTGDTKTPMGQRHHDVYILFYTQVSHFAVKSTS